MRLLLCTFALLLVGCGSDNTIAPNWVDAPKFTVDAVELEQVSDAGSALRVVLTVTNPNDDPVPLVDTTYTLTVDGTRYTTTTNPNAEAPALRSVTFALPAVIVGSATGSYAVEGSITYKPLGQLREVLTDIGIPLPTTRFSGAGDVTDKSTRVSVPGPGPTLEPQPAHVPLAPSGGQTAPPDASDDAPDPTPATSGGAGDADGDAPADE